MIVTKIKQYDVFVVDDNGMQELISGAIDIPGCKLSCYANAEDCLEQLTKSNCDLLVCVAQASDVDGLALLQEAKKIAPWVPVVVVSDCGNVSMAVRALKLGAIDVIVKPSNGESYLCKIKSLIEKKHFLSSCPSQVLTRTEREVLKLILEGKSNKEIAYEFQRTSRTIERHRTNIFQKFEVKNVVELVKKAIFMGLDDV